MQNFSFKYIFPVLFSVLYLSDTPLFAEPKKDGIAKNKQVQSDKNVKEVLLNIRAIKGNNPLAEDSDKSLARDVDKRIEDLTNKLSSYDFQSFKLVSEQSLSVPVKKKTTINLTEKTVLIVRPLYTEDKRVGLWLKWTDSSGERTLIDTRMHFNADENMLAGTNCKNNKALILAISAVPAAPVSSEAR